MRCLKIRRKREQNSSYQDLHRDKKDAWSKFMRPFTGLKRILLYKMQPLVAGLPREFAGAVVLFISNGMKLEKYEYLEKENLSLEYGIAGIVERKKEEFAPVFQRGIVVGVSLCILCVVPLMVALIVASGEITYIYCVAFLLVMIAIAVLLFVKNGMVQSSYDKLLEEGDYTREKKTFNRKNSTAITIYWCVTTALYLGISFITMRWDRTWIIWPVAGVLFGAVEAILAVRQKNKN